MNVTKTVKLNEFVQIKEHNSNEIVVGKVIEIDGGEIDVLFLEKVPGSWKKKPKFRIQRPFRSKFISTNSVLKVLRRTKEGKAGCYQFSDLDMFREDSDTELDSETSEYEIFTRGKKCAKVIIVSIIIQ